MSPDPTQHDLTAEQVVRLEKLAVLTGKSCSELLDEWLASAVSTQSLKDVSIRKTEQSLYDVLSERGMLGCFDGPTDLSTNPKHMEGFGRDGNGSNSH